MPYEPTPDERRVIAWLRDKGLAIELRGVSGGIHFGLADAIEQGHHHD